MNKPTLARNMMQLSALFAVVLISVSIMGAGCSSSAEIKAGTTGTSANGDAMTDTRPEADVDTDVEIDTQATTPTPATNTVMTATKTPATKPTAANAYKDGTYSATGNYNSPAGSEQLKVSVTLKSDVVTDASATLMATNPKSVYMQTQFISGFKTYVVGKKLSDVNVGKVSGSSLTGIGFNDAITKIKAQAAVK